MRDNHDSPRPERRLASLYLRVIAANLLLTTGLAAFSLWVWSGLRAEGSLLHAVLSRNSGQCQPRIISTSIPVEVDEEGKRPPENVPKDGYVGDQGTQLPDAALMTEVDLIRDGRRETRLRLGHPDVLRPSTVHVVNLWAPWCKPCLRELPGLQDLFQRKAAVWGNAVEFVPIKVLDGANPTAAYERFATQLPPSRVRLADRSSDDLLVSALRADHKRALYRGHLPVTLILDCNRRVRWAQFAPLGPTELAELDSTVERLVEELADTSDLASCRQTWCGNGRCEGPEANRGHDFCPLDCGDPRPVANSTVKPTVLGTEPTAPTSGPSCPADCARCDELGNCIGRLKPRPGARNKQLEEEIFGASEPCGDGLCDGTIGEDSTTCCRDCPCAGTFTCEAGADGRHQCQARIK